TPETSVDTDRNVDHVSFIKIDRALLLAIQPENLPSTLHWDENLLSRVPVQRRSFASLGAHIGDRKAHCAFLYVMFERGILCDSHPYHVDDVPLVARNALVEESHIKRLDVFLTRATHSRSILSFEM